MPHAPFDHRDLPGAAGSSGASAPRPAPAPQPAKGARGAVTDNALGSAWMAMSVLAASAMVLSVRAMSEGLDSRMTVLLRSIGVLICLAPLLALPNLRRQIRFSSPRLHLIRGGLIAVSTQFGFYAIAHLPLATATVLSFTAPIFATLLAVPLNGEKVGVRRWSAVGAGFLGALIILRPGAGGFDMAMLAAILAAVLFALALAMSRGVAAADGPMASLISANLLTALVALPLALPVWGMPATGGAWAIFVLLVASSGLRSLGDLQAYRHGDASVMGAITYIRLVLIAIAAWAFFEETPDGPTLLGGGIIIASTLYIAYRERAAKRAARRDAAAAPA